MSLRTLGKGAYVVSEPQPNRPPSNAQTIIFMVILSFACALVLSLLASALAEPKTLAKDLDRIKQLMIATKLLSHHGYFLMKDAEGKEVPAKYSKDGILVPGTTKDFATKEQILEVYKKRIRTRLVNDQGKITTFEKAGLDEEQYISTYRKLGYYKQPWKLIYEVLPNKEADEKDKPVAYVIPVNGFGLWDAIYGYISIEPDGDTVVGISWYDQKETPGLGANIAEPYWQNLFPGKKIFLESPDGKTDFKTAPIGITVVKGKVSEVLGTSPKAQSAVDGMTGATLTGNGVTDAYRDVLTAYRSFFMEIHQSSLKAMKA
jgi:Na+-transporting NADH:ubiquinone oxidoreductase subunit C